MAEENGLIVSIDRGVLLDACHQMRQWQQTYPRETPLTISVNLSTKHFAQAGLVEQIAHSLKQTGIAPHSLKLEITESAIMQQPETVTGKLHQLRELQTQISMDDFGTGYSSLSYLHRFPLDTLKIDRSFVSRLGQPEEHGEIVQTIVTLAHHLNMDVVAEGVETAEQAAPTQGDGLRVGLRVWPGLLLRQTAPRKSGGGATGGATDGGISSATAVRRRRMGVGRLNRAALRTSGSLPRGPQRGQRKSRKALQNWGHFRLF